MIGLSSQAKDSINEVIDGLFVVIAAQFLGNIFKLKDSNQQILSLASGVGLSYLFIQSMQNRHPNRLEQLFLIGLLKSANSYVESLREKTKANVTERIDGIVREAKLRKEPLAQTKINEVVKEELDKAKVHMKTIAESESTKFRNLGSMMDITRISSATGDSDPSVYFQVVKDGKTCKECERLHLMNDGITPRVWRLSELKQGYHKRGEDNASAFGLHPHCRCSIIYLSKGFGFKNGRVSYLSEDHDEYSKQKS